MDNEPKIICAVAYRRYLENCDAEVYIPLDEHAITAKRYLRSIHTKNWNKAEAIFQ